MEQQTLFSTESEPEAPPTPEIIRLRDAELILYSGFYSPAFSHKCYDQLTRSLQWEQPTLRFAGKTQRIPRLQAWHGDANAHYGYSGLALSPRPLSPLLERLRSDVSASVGSAFNSVLANWYRTERDSVSWHADDEPELGAAPTIASLSFGATRRFQLKHKATPSLKFSLDLHAGDLLVMRPPTQAYWLHQLPKTARACGGRVNLTFRTCVSP